MFVAGLISALVWAAEPATPPVPQRRHPRVELATGPMVGPHALGNEECRPEENRCETRGSFFGAGWSADVRIRLFKPLYLNVRPWIVGNVARDKVFTGVVGGGFGLGLYGKHVFGRGEYVPLVAFGDSNFTPPFFEGEVASDQWSNHAGMLTVGFRKSVHDRINVELWGGPMFGPKSRRSLPDGTVDERTLVTFMLGLGVSFAVLDQ